MNEKDEHPPKKSSRSFPSTDIPNGHSSTETYHEPLRAPPPAKHAPSSRHTSQARSPSNPFCEGDGLRRGSKDPEKAAFDRHSMPSQRLSTRNPSVASSEEEEEDEFGEDDDDPKRHAFWILVCRISISVFGAIDLYFSDLSIRPCPPSRTPHCSLHPPHNHTSPPSLPHIPHPVRPTAQHSLLQPLIPAPRTPTRPDFFLSRNQLHPLPQRWQYSHPRICKLTITHLRDDHRNSRVGWRCLLVLYCYIR